jgi:predicted RNase H-like HicB family nuclease
MVTLKYIHWKDEDWYLGYLVDYPDYITQGKSLEELAQNLKDLYQDITSAEIPFLRRMDDLVIA